MAIPLASEFARPPAALIDGDQISIVELRERDPKLVALVREAKDSDLRGLFEESIRVAERLGNIHLLRSARSGMIATQRFVGEWDDALQAADAFIAECEGVTTNPVERAVRLQRAYIRQARDDSAGALEDIEKGLANEPLVVFLLVELGRLDQATLELAAKRGGEPTARRRPRLDGSSS